MVDTDLWEYRPVYLLHTASTAAESEIGNVNGNTQQNWRGMPLF